MVGLFREEAAVGLLPAVGALLTDPHFYQVLPSWPLDLDAPHCRVDREPRGAELSVRAGLDTGWAVEGCREAPESVRHVGPGSVSGSGRYPGSYPIGTCVSIHAAARLSIPRRQKNSSPNFQRF